GPAAGPRASHAKASRCQPPGEPRRRDRGCGRRNADRARRRRLARTATDLPSLRDLLAVLLAARARLDRRGEIEQLAERLLVAGGESCSPGSLELLQRCLQLALLGERTRTGEFLAHDTGRRRTLGRTKSTQRQAAATTIRAQAGLAFGVVTSGTSHSVHPRLTTCSSQKSFAMLPTP